MPSMDASALPTTARERRWSLAAAIASVTVFGLSVGQAGPLLSLLLEAAWHRCDAERAECRCDVHRRHHRSAGRAAAGPALRGPKLPVGRIRPRHRAVPGDEAARQHRAPGSCCALLGAAVGSSIFTAGEAWINQLAGDTGRGRIIGIYAAALSAGFGTGPLVLSLTGIEGWPPFLVNAAISALATLPLLGVGEASRNLRPGARRGSAAHVRARTGHPRRGRGVRSL